MSESMTENHHQKVSQRGSHYKRTPWNKGLTKDDPRVRKNSESAQETKKQKGPYTPWNKGLTKDEDERIRGLSSEKNPMYGKHPEAWNKGLTKDTDTRMKAASDNHKGSVAWNKGISTPGHPYSEQTKEKIRQTHLSPEFQQKRHDIMKQNGTLGVHSDTAIENKVYSDLLTKYSKDNIVKQYMDSRCPYNCDFYIKSEDKFIEVHRNWTHGGMPYDPNDNDCRKQLSFWEEKAKTSKYYKNAIYAWTDLEVRKLNTARKNNLNFEVMYP